MGVELDRGRTWVADVDWVNRRLEGGVGWPHGPLVDIRAERIGEAFGFSGQVHRLWATTAGGSSVTLVAKVEAADRIRTAVAVRSHVESPLGTSIPRCWGSFVEVGDVGDEVGVILLEDIAPAVQGDDLVGTTAERADALTSVVRGLHDIDVNAAADDEVPIWEARAHDAGLWARRHESLKARHAEQFDAATWTRLERLEDDAHAAGRALATGERRWIHVDPHLDNVLWRPDGSAVLLDWSNARLGPPAFDIAVLLASTCFCRSPCSRPDDVFDAYERSGRPLTDVDSLRDDVALALVVLFRSSLGWLARDDVPEPHPRVGGLRVDGLRRVRNGLEWLEQIA